MLIYQRVFSWSNVCFSRPLGHDITHGTTSVASPMGPRDRKGWEPVDEQFTRSRHPKESGDLHVCTRHWMLFAHPKKHICYGSPSGIKRHQTPFRPVSLRAALRETKMKVSLWVLDSLSPNAWHLEYIIHWCLKGHISDASSGTLSLSILVIFFGSCGSNCPTLERSSCNGCNNVTLAARPDH